jgi:hypothetical protein
MFPIAFGIGTRGRDKKKLRVLPVRQPDNLSINWSGSFRPYIPATDHDNHFWHVFISIPNVG